MKNFLLIVLGVAFCSIKLYAQEIQLKGKITAFNTYALNYVLVEATKSKHQVKTDSLGKFVITYDKKDRLKITAAGFTKQYLPVKGDTAKVINLVFKGSKKAGNKAVEAQHISREDLEYGLKFKKNENNDYASYQDIYAMIQGVYPRVRINGDTGDKKLYLTSRGPHSLSSGEEALLVVDGIVSTNISGISPIQVEAIRVLVGVETSAYGTRGGCGVIEIDMKH